MSFNNLLNINAASMLVTATAVSQAFQWPISYGNFAMFTNMGGAAVFVKSGNSSVTVTAGGGVCIAQGSIHVFTVDNPDTYFALISLTGSCPVAVSRGDGR